MSGVNGMPDRDGVALKLRSASSRFFDPRIIGKVSAAGFLLGAILGWMLATSDDSWRTWSELAPGAHGGHVVGEVLVVMFTGMVGWVVCVVAMLAVGATLGIAASVARRLSRRTIR
jgi:hypothetical protein